jgi:hypothetical protein
MIEPISKTNQILTTGLFVGYSKYTKSALIALAILSAFIASYVIYRVFRKEKIVHHHAVISSPVFNKTLHPNPSSDQVEILSDSPPPSKRKQNNQSLESEKNEKLVDDDLNYARTLQEEMDALYAKELQDQFKALEKDTKPKSPSEALSAPKLTTEEPLIIDEELDKKIDSTPDLISEQPSVDEELDKKRELIDYQLLKKSRLKDVYKELDRLKMSILTPELEKKIDDALEKVESHKTNFLFHNNQKEVKVILGRAFEIKNLYQETHDIFIHAQATKWFAISCLIRELVKVFNPQDSIKYFHFLRAPTPEQKGGLSIHEYKELLSAASNSSQVHDHSELGDHLLSADGYLLNSTNGESALNFLSKNYSILSRDPKMFSNIIRSIFKDFVSLKIPKDRLNILVERMNTLINGLGDKRCGNLFVICVPKAITPDVQYRSHPFGKPCDCHDTIPDLEILKDLQNFQLNKSTLCRNTQAGQPPQFRLKVSALTPENGVLSFLLTPIPRDEKKSLKKEIIRIAVEAHQLVKDSQVPG